jgi:hypothetical protein
MLYKKNAIFNTDEAEKPTCSKQTKAHPVRWIEADIIVPAVLKISKCTTSEFPA